MVTDAWSDVERAKWVGLRIEELQMRFSNPQMASKSKKSYLQALNKNRFSVVPVLIPRFHTSGRQQLLIP